MRENACCDSNFVYVANFNLDTSHTHLYSADSQTNNNNTTQEQKIYHKKLLRFFFVSFYVCSSKWTSSEKRTKINHLANSEQLFVIRLNGSSSKQASKPATREREKKRPTTIINKVIKLYSNGWKKNRRLFVVRCFRDETLQARKKPNKRYRPDKLKGTKWNKTWNNNNWIE